jgi:asparagine synthase (glutamine-hydrolysing)
VVQRVGHPVFELVSHDWLTGAVQADPVSIPMRVRNGLERALDLAMWLDLYQPDLQLP